MPDKIAKFIASLDRKTRERLKKRLLELKQGLFQSRRDIKKLSGNDGKNYRLRMGNIRIVFKVTGKEVEVVDIDYRGNIY